MFDSSTRSNGDLAGVFEYDGETGPTPASVDFKVMAPAESPWSDTPLLGKMLGREQALAHPALKEAMHVAEHIVREDTRVRRFLDSFDVS